jgi:hypothetical protein
MIPLRGIGRTSQAQPAAPGRPPGSCMGLRLRAAGSTCSGASREVVLSLVLERYGM